MTSYKRWVLAEGGDAIVKWEPGVQVEGVFEGQKDGKFGSLGMVSTDAGERKTFPITTALALDLEALKVQVGETVRFKCTGWKKNEKTGREFKTFETDVLRDSAAPVLDAFGDPVEEP
jgi:hypothetical protein